LRSNLGPQIGNQTGDREFSRYFSYFNNLRYGVPSRKAFQQTVLTACVAIRLSVQLSFTPHFILTFLLLPKARLAQAGAEYIVSADM